MSADPENEYFSDGMTEEIINALAKVPGMQVASRTSCFAFKGKEVDVREIGEKLGVSSVLEGSVRKVGNRVRITAQLINVAERLSPLVRDLRPPARGRLRHPGRDLPRHRGRA